jgi:cytochrome P450
MLVGHMTDLFSDEMRRNPFPAYAHVRRASPVMRIPPPFDAWAVFDYETVKRAFADSMLFSSEVNAPRHWFLFQDAPRHTKQRGLISKGFTPRMIAGLEPRIREISRRLLDAVVHRGEMDMAADYATPLPMIVISEMIGIPADDWPRYKRWVEGILALSHTRSGETAKAEGMNKFRAVAAEMSEYLEQMISSRKQSPRDDLLTRLIEAEMDGQRLTHEEILGFFQLLILAGQETTTNLINNAILCLTEHPDQLERLRADPDRLLPAAIEEVLRYRPPFLWLMRTPKREVELHGQTIPAGALVLLVVASANRDEAQFPDADRFDMARDPNPHLAFGHGSHFCLGAPLSRLEARIALTDVLKRLPDLRRAGDEPWEPRQALHVYGPTNLPVRFTPAAK